MPQPRGPYSVGTKRVQVTDHSRWDPYAPTPEKRSPMLQLWYPIRNNESLTQAPWMPFNATSYFEKEKDCPSGTFQSIVTLTFIDGSAVFPLIANNTLPVLVFSPGSQGLCCYYTAFLSSIASYGYTVVGIDHPYDSYPLERPNGEVILHANTTDDIVYAAQVRRNDTLWLASQLTVANITRWLAVSPEVMKNLDTVKLGVFGHSLGGNTASLVMQDQLSPYKASAPLDGAFFSPLNITGFYWPMLYIAASNSCYHQMLVDEWSKISGWKLAVEINGTTHASFSDLVVFKRRMPDLDLQDPGSIEEERMIEIVVTYLKAFFEWQLLGKEQDKLMRNESRAFPDVTFEDLEEGPTSREDFLLKQPGGNA